MLKLAINAEEPVSVHLFLYCSNFQPNSKSLVAIYMCPKHLQQIDASASHGLAADGSVTTFELLGIQCFASTSFEHTVVAYG